MLLYITFNQSIRDNIVLCEVTSFYFLNASTISVTPVIFNVQYHSLSVRDSTSNRQNNKIIIIILLLETLAAVTPQEAHKCIRDLLYPRGQHLPSHESELVLTDRFVQFFQSKVASSRTTLDDVQQLLPSVLDSAPANVPVLDCFPPVAHAELVKLVRWSVGKSWMLDPAPTAWLKQPAVLGCCAGLLCWAAVLGCCAGLLCWAVSFHMMSVINRSLASTTGPDCLKEGVIVPILNKQCLEINLLKKYRAVSNVSFLGKVVDRIVAACPTAI